MGGAGAGAWAGGEARCIGAPHEGQNATPSATWLPQDEQNGIGLTPRPESDVRVLTFPEGDSVHIHARIRRPFRKGYYKGLRIPETGANDGY